jgi:hypothetical protein
MERRLAEIQRELAPDVPADAPLEAHAADHGSVDVSAGPFPSLDALREFERAVAELPGVCEVTVRGYETGNRAILEVQLREETS